MSLPWTDLLIRKFSGPLLIVSWCVQPLHFKLKKKYGQVSYFIFITRRPWLKCMLLYPSCIASSHYPTLTLLFSFLSLLAFSHVSWQRRCFSVSFCSHPLQCLPSHPVLVRSDEDFDLDDDVSSDAVVTCPFNLDDIPVAQEVDDDEAVPQEAIFDGLFLQQEGSQGDGPTWEQTPVTTLNLSSLERMFRINDRSTAIKLLNRRVNVVLDPDLKLRADDPNLLWKGSKHFLDFILVVSGKIGLDAFLPKTVADHNFSLTLNLRLQSRQFRPKFGKLGFDPTGSMMAIGDGQSTELWLGFCPVGNLEDIDLANNSPLLSEKHGDTRLTSVHYRMGIMFLACLLSQIPSMPVHVMYPYGPRTDFTEWKIEDATNVLCVIYQSLPLLLLSPNPVPALDGRAPCFIHSCCPNYCHNFRIFMRIQDCVWMRAKSLVWTTLWISILFLVLIYHIMTVAAVMFVLVIDVIVSLLLLLLLLYSSISFIDVLLTSL